MNQFFDENHKKEIARIEELWENLHDLADMAKKYGIDDIFQDNGAKILQQLVYLNFNILLGREGNDAISARGIEWEMKSVNIELTSGFSTNHHTNQHIIAKYRKVPWSFAIYKGISLQEIYVLTPRQLEPIFAHWEKQLLEDPTRTHLNNPKIPVKFVRQNGVRVFPIDTNNPIDPDSIH